MCGNGVPVSAGQLRPGGAAGWAGDLMLRSRWGGAGRGRSVEGDPRWIQPGIRRAGVGAYFLISFCPVHHHRGLLLSRGAADRRKQWQEGSAERFPCGAGRHAAFP